MKTQTSKTAAVMNLISRGAAPAAGDGGQVPAVPTERTIEEITQEILQAQQTGGEALLTIGKGLIEAKAKLNHGEWLEWLTERVNYSPRSAQKLMKLAREWTNASTLTHLGASKAFALLVLPEDEREAFLAGTHTVDGEEKTVIDMSARELEKALRDREQALADKALAEESCAKMEQDMTMAKQLLQTAQEERDTALKEAKERQGLLRAAELETTRLSQELDELKARPVEVAVEVDQEAVARARAEGEAAKAAELDALQKKLDKAHAAQDKAIAAQVAAEDKQKAAEAELATVRAKLEASAKTEKQSLINSDTVVAQFEFYFNQAQESANKMSGLLLKARRRDEETLAKQLENALRALSDKIREAAV